MLEPEILERLQAITDEEQAILDGRTTIDRELYMQGQSNTINAKKLLDSGKLITVRPHTRFIHFPEHKHDYVEMVYMCAGQTTHIVNGKAILLEQGDLLFLSQSATHEVCKAEEGDVAVAGIDELARSRILSDGSSAHTLPDYSNTVCHISQLLTLPNSPGIISWILYIFCANWHKMPPHLSHSELTKHIYSLGA